MPLIDYTQLQTEVCATTHTVDARLIFQIHRPSAQSHGFPTSSS